MKFEYLPGATPINSDEREGLIPSITTQSDLNELEKANIRIGQEWALKSRRLKKEILTLTGLFELHKKLFGQVWEWAGKQRKSEKNIGVAPHQIAQELQKLCQDTLYWMENETYNWDELGYRFHHRLVFIHPFANGNGRHARIATDLLLNYNDQVAFTWGSSDLTKNNQVRDSYIKALRSADDGDYTQLAKFVRS